MVILEWIEDLDPRTPEILVITSRNGHVVLPCDSRDVAVLDGHGPPGLLQLKLLFGPHVRDGHVEAKNSAVHCVDELSQPCLQGRALLPALAPNPKGQLSNDDRARVTVVFSFSSQAITPAWPFFLAG